MAPSVAKHVLAAGNITLYAVYSDAVLSAVLLLSVLFEVSAACHKACKSLGRSNSQSGGSLVAAASMSSQHDVSQVAVALSIDERCDVTIPLLAQVSQTSCIEWKNRYHRICLPRCKCAQEVFGQRIGHR